MKTKITILSVLLVLLVSIPTMAISPDPLVITYSDGVKNNGQPGAAYTLISFIQDADNAYSLDTIMRFERTGTNNYTGVLWYNTVFNGGNAVPDGLNAIQFGSNTTTQYKYLVVKAKQSSTSNFSIKLDQIAPLTAPLQNAGVKSIFASINKWKSYVYDLPTLAPTHVDKPFNRLTIIPDYSNTNTPTSLCFINTIYFTNNEIVTIEPATPTFTKTSTSVELTWAATAGATSYRIVDGVTGGLVKDGISGVTTTITGLTPNASYSFCLIAVSENVIESKASNVINFTTDSTTALFPQIKSFKTTVNVKGKAIELMDDALTTEIYTPSGMHVKRAWNQPSGTIIPLEQGIFFVKVSTLKSSTVQKIIIR